MSSASASANSPVPLSTVVVYSLPAVSLGFMGALVSIYLLKFSTDVLLIAPGLMGALFGLSKLWDAVSDPLAGYWSDRTRSQLGRRRPWMIAAAAPMGLAFIALWSPPGSLGADGLAVWMGATIILFYTAGTAVGIPHLALGAELTSDYHGRSRVFGGRLLFEFVGIFLAAGSLSLLELAEEPQLVATWIAVSGALVGAGLIVWPAWRMRERPDYQGRGAHRPYGAMRDVLRNPHARLLLVIFFLDQLGFTLLFTTFPYANEYILHADGLTGAFVGAAIGAAVVFYPIWFPLSRRFGKRNPWLVATAIKAVAFGVIFFLEPGQWTLLFVLTVVIGGLQGAGGILGPSIKADVIDYDEYQTGERKEGAYFAGWNLAVKAAAGFAIVAAGALLQGAGFQPNVEQNATALLAIRALFGGLPCLFLTIAALLMLRFRLNAQEHGEIRSALDARAAQAS
jgi:GPH family glycoside/pentoside/hexuronide:cation symporter